MKFGKHLERQMRPEWAAYYIDYKGLKDLIKEAVREAEQSGGAVNFSPRTTSLSIVRAAKGADAAEERFFQKLEGEVDKIGKFTQRLVDELRAKLRSLNPKAAAAAAAQRGEAAPAAASSSGAVAETPASVDALMAEAKGVGEEYLALEKYANLNYMGIHKILKKHDKVGLYASTCAPLSFFFARGAATPQLTPRKKKNPNHQNRCSRTPPAASSTSPTSTSSPGSRAPTPTSSSN
jgi:SPX domain protein involved in polyphosphate accumulation